MGKPTLKQAENSLHFIFCFFHPKLTLTFVNKLSFRGREGGGMFLKSILKLWFLALSVGFFSAAGYHHEQLLSATVNLLLPDCTLRAGNLL